MQVLNRKGTIMKRKLSAVLFVCLMSLGGVNTSQAAASDYGVSVFDLFVARPLGLAATAAGSAFFVVAWPFAAATSTVDETANTLVVTPGKFTFVRPVGDFTSHTSDQSSDTAASLRRNSSMARGKTQPTGRSSDQKIAKQKPENRTRLAMKDLPPGQRNPSRQD
jgi:hypothetical protein